MNISLPLLECELAEDCIIHCYTPSAKHSDWHKVDIHSSTKRTYRMEWQFSYQESEVLFYAVTH